MVFRRKKPIAVFHGYVAGSENDFLDILVLGEYNVDTLVKGTKRYLPSEYSTTRVGFWGFPELHPLLFKKQSCEIRSYTIMT